MAWVEPKGAGFRVRHRHPDGTIETLARYDSKVEARRHAQRFNAGAPESATAAAAVPKLVHAIPPNPHSAADVTNTSETAAPALAPSFGTVIPDPLRPARRTAPRHPRLESPAITTAPNTALTLAEWIELWSNAHQVSPNTAAKYESHLRVHILPKFGATPIDQITRIEVKIWAKELCERMATSSAHSILSLLSTVLGEAENDRHIRSNPCQGLRINHRNSDEKVIAAPLQVLQLADRMDPTCATMVITAAYTGMRWGELAGLAWHNVLLDQEIPEIVIDPKEGALHELAGRVWLDEPKTENSPRTIALPPFLARMLAVKFSIARYDTVFTGARGAFLRRSNFRQRVWDPAANGVLNHDNPARRTPIAPGMTFHGLRHSHKTWMKEEGIDSFVQDKRLGHATPSIGDRYSHITPVMTLEVVDRLEARYQQSVRDFATLPKAPPGYTA